MKNRVFIIAEAGVNHNGDLQKAYELIDIAKDAGVDAVKFQTIKSPENNISKFAKMADYQKENTGMEESQIEMIKKLFIGYEEFKKIKEYCEKKEIMFLSTPFDKESVDFLCDLGVKIIKIPSGEITNLPYLRKIATKRKPVILSTGMSNLGDIESCLNVLTKDGLRNEEITILHCNTEYPTPFSDVNLNAMLTIKNAFPGIKIGYSDHSLGIEVPIAAVALGAEVIEKHFTLDKKLPGPDHKASLDPKELTLMVKSIRNIEIALGNGVKKASASEQKNIEIARKSIVAKTDIKRGDIFSEANMTVKRPGNGISPMKWDDLIGKIASKDYKADELIEI
jgi:N,N'-diacetyllegionaminate synthase